MQTCLERTLRSFHYPTCHYGRANSSKMQGSNLKRDGCCIFTSANYFIHFSIMAQHFEQLTRDRRDQKAAPSTAAMVIFIISVLVKSSLAVEITYCPNSTGIITHVCYSTIHATILQSYVIRVPRDPSTEHSREHPQHLEALREKLVCSRHTHNVIVDVRLHIVHCVSP